MTRWSYSSMVALLESFARHEDALSEPRAHRRRQIIDAAKELFIRHGYRKASIDEVARRAGVAKGTVYVYARNKADLLIQVIIEEKRLLLEKLRPALDEDQTPRQRLRWWLRTALVVHEEMPLLARLMSGDREILDLFAEMDPQARERMVELHQTMIGGLLEEAARPHRWTPSELEDRVKVLLGLMYTANSFADERVRGGLSNERFVEVLTESLLEGLLPRSAGRGERGER